MLARSTKLLANPLPIPTHIRHEAKEVADKIARFASSRKVQIVALAGVSSVTLGLIAFSLWPHSMQFSYATDNCFTNPVLLPRLVSEKTSHTYAANPIPSVSLAGYPLYAHTTCVVPASAPKEQSTERISFGNTLFRKAIQVNTGQLPTVQDRAQLKDPLPANSPLVLTLDRADRVFSYQVTIGDKKIECDTNDRTLTCDIPSLGLAQSTQYSIELHRLFNGEFTQTIIAKSVTTVQAVQITGSSITTDQVIYDVPNEITLTLNKSAESFSGAHLHLVTGDTRKEVPTTASLTDKVITVRFSEPLARSASFILDIGKITASDGGYLASPFSLPFKTSGGPKVLSVNIGSSKVQPSSSVVITFDSTVSSAQSLGDFIKLETANGAIAASVSTKGRTVTISPKSNLSRCTSFTVKVLDGLKNEAGISGGSSWQLKSKTICQTTFSIGTSVQGRDITAYSFGSGPSTIVFVGTTHGDEKSSTYVLNKWIDYLETNYDRIPSNRTIIVIPNLNPDGFAANRRTNAHNVDLNRNFPADDWKQGVTMPDKTYNSNGGGSAPLSEPESSALANYILGVNPRLVLTYHAAAGVVIPNDAGDSDALAHAYDQNSNVGYENTGDGIFLYDTTGSFEDWLYDKPGITALLVELWTKSGNEFAKHQNAMWAMVQLP